MPITPAHSLGLSIRPGLLDDLSAITEIYNDAILSTNATFDTNPKSVEEQRAWFRQHGDKYPLIVAEMDGQVVGWAALSPWSDRCAYADTAEISLYVRKEDRGKGIGRRLIENIIASGKRAGLHTVIARITEGNEASVHLHASLGFEHIGIMREVGRKFGRLLDVHIMQLVYPKEGAGKQFQGGLI
ncbi:MAG: N-acetyltransferase family protein [Candidatus Thermoplasmatota archaeon]